MTAIYQTVFAAQPVNVWNSISSSASDIKDLKMLRSRDEAAGMPKVSSIHRPSKGCDMKTTTHKRPPSANETGETWNLKLLCFNFGEMLIIITLPSCTFFILGLEPMLQKQ